MKIVKITKTGLYYKVKFDNDEVYKFHESIIIKYLFLKKGTVVTVQECKIDGKDEWVRIPSGWIAGYYDNEYLIK